ncbi:MAG: hypothetical protein EAZ92_17555 [Candidatus Kapaibacterium sp.]|nr:MAG: hypothetical protein EAZ92_17555 [Candidatus Kapabacteria bacterium]
MSAGKVSASDTKPESPTVTAFPVLLANIKAMKQSTFQKRLRNACAMFAQSNHTNEVHTRYKMNRQENVEEKFSSRQGSA